AHDPARLDARPPEAADGHVVNPQQWVGLVTDAVHGFALYEALPLMAKPLN
ncbi:hypothetical protein H632_c5109p0, partial [Helicosporidium sp. ATCC 50920]